jgi:hypothetical protein
MAKINAGEFLRVWRQSQRQPVGAMSGIHDLVDLLGGLPGAHTQRSKHKDLVNRGGKGPVNQYNKTGDNYSLGSSMQSTWWGDNHQVKGKFGHQRNFAGDNFMKSSNVDSFQSTWFGDNKAKVGGKSKVEQRNYDGDNFLTGLKRGKIKADQSTWHGTNTATGPKDGTIDLTQRTLDGKNKFIQGDNSTSKTKQIANGGENEFIGGNDSTSDHTFTGDKSKDKYTAGERSTDKVTVDGKEKTLDIDTKDKDDHVKVGGTGHSGTINTGDGANDQIDMASLDHKGLTIKDKDGATINYGDTKKKDNMGDHFKENEYKKGKDGTWGWYARGGDEAAKARVSFDGDPSKYRHNFGGEGGPMSHDALVKAQEEWQAAEDAKKKK